MLASRDVIAESKDSNERRKDAKAIEYFEETFLCTGECREELEANGILMTHIDVKREAARLADVAATRKETKKEL
jgi:hypothetical protein|tara:strand:+ start:150 stop:374 length:225 start_codon:yes stop_codon:yes gene_type:complete